MLLKARFHYKRGKIYSLFYCFIYLFIVLLICFILCFIAIVIVVLKNIYVIFLICAYIMMLFQNLVLINYLSQ